MRQEMEGGLTAAAGFVLGAFGAVVTFWRIGEDGGEGKSGQEEGREQHDVRYVQTRE